MLQEKPKVWGSHWVRVNQENLQRENLSPHRVEVRDLNQVQAYTDTCPKTFNRQIFHSFFLLFFILAYNVYNKTAKTSYSSNTGAGAVCAGRAFCINSFSGNESCSACGLAIV